MQPQHKSLLFSQLLRRIVYVVVVLIVIILFVLFLILKHYNISAKTVWQLVTGNSVQLKQAEGRTTIALLGIGGKDHAGGMLTDTILLASIKLSTNDVLLISLPRDVWVPSLHDRINTAYETGETGKSGNGFVKVKSVLEEVTGLPVQYAALIDFSGFIKIIDLVGGVDVHIVETFTDTEYPIAGKENDLCSGDPKYACRYETITFVKGVEHMDGARALKYVRSRHAAGDAGTDFSRGERQQAVITALKDKLLTRENLTNISVLKQLKDTFSQAVVTDMNNDEALLIAQQLVTAAPTLRHAALTQDLPEKKQSGLLINPMQSDYEGKWVLIPKAGAGNFSAIQAYFHCTLEPANNCQ